MNKKTDNRERFSGRNPAFEVKTDKVQKNRHVRFASKEQVDSANAVVLNQFYETFKKLAE